MNVVTVMFLFAMSFATGVLGIAAVLAGEPDAAWKFATTALIAGGFAMVLWELEDRR